MSETIASASPEMRRKLDRVIIDIQEEIVEKGPDRGTRTKRRGVRAKTLDDLHPDPRRLRDHYQPWYSRALRVVEQLLPDRYDEFRALYMIQKRREIDVATYTVSDYLRGMIVTTHFGTQKAFDHVTAGLGRFGDQVEILAAAQSRLDSTLGDIRGVLEAELFDDEISAARELLAARHLRSAGVVAGVVLERHLKRLVVNHVRGFRKKPQLASLNEALKSAEVYDVPQWRQIQRLGDLRNLAAHDGERDPTRDEIDELIRGVEKVIATVF